jgi:ribosomal RNA-processing protein 9
VSRLSLNAVAVSSDGALLAVGGGDRKVYAFDARSGAFLQAFPGHRLVTAATGHKQCTCMCSHILVSPIESCLFAYACHVDPASHRDAITALSFREGTHTLFSGSADRTVKLWSLDDRAYMDTLFGHQAEVRPPQGRCTVSTEMGKGSW